MSLGGNIRALREAKGWSTHRLAQEAATHQSSVWRFEADEVRPRQHTLAALAKALGCDPIYLEHGSPLALVPATNKRRIRIFDLAQSNLRITRETLLLELVAEDDHVWTDLESPSMVFAIIFRGDSMLPEFRDGDIVTIDADRPVRPGDFVLAKEEKSEGPPVLRQYAHTRSGAQTGDVIELRPLNPVYPVWSSSDTEFVLLGVAIEFKREINIIK